MPTKIDFKLTPQKLLPKIERLFELSGRKILSIEKTWKPEHGTPVFTVKGKYSTRGWTEWTQGFQFGSALLQFDATGDERFLEIGRRNTIERMATHVSHIGVHDHGFNNISTYGNLLRLIREGKIPWSEREKDFCELALKVSGAVQAARWTRLADGTGFIHSFNGPHSLFVDTIRSCRALALAHQLGHVLMGEQDARISLLQRLVEHALTTARYNVYFGEGRDAYDVRGRTAHEAVFNVSNGVFRCPNSQQGYSPFSTWTRGLAWAILGFAELLELLVGGVRKNPADPAYQARGSRRNEALATLPEKMSLHTSSATVQGRNARQDSGTSLVDRSLSATFGGCLPTAATIRNLLCRAATATADFYIANACADGVPMWDTGAPNLHRLGDYLGKSADPFNNWEPIDSSAAAIAAQGLVRLGNYLIVQGDKIMGRRYRQAGLAVASTIFDEPYLSTNSKHQGLILHSVYHRPNGWDYIAPGQKVPNGESSMWGDYHARELALLLLREARAEKYPTFFGCI